jgi:hypothetical protein
MTDKQFVMWLRGFTEACHHLAPTPAQWDKIIETLKNVKEDSGCSCVTKTYTYPYTINATNNSGVATQYNPETPQTLLHG